MLKQFSRLTHEAEGRFATAEELKFLETYLAGVDDRIATYERIRDRSESIVDHWEMVKRAHPKDLFHQNGRDISQICRRDATDILRLSATTMLIDDLDRLREGFLVWYQTIVKSYNYKSYAAVNYHLIQDVIRSFLAPEEAELILPAFRLEHGILGS